MFGAGDHIRCLICLEQGHPSQACPLAKGRRLGFRSLSEAHLQACREGLLVSSSSSRSNINALLVSVLVGCDLDANEDGLELSAAAHVGGGNVKVVSRWFSCCRHDVDPALRWTTLTVDKDSQRTRAIEPEDFPNKGIVVFDLDEAVIKYDVSTYALTVAHGVEPRWRSVSNN